MRREESCSISNRLRLSAFGSRGVVDVATSFASRARDRLSPAPMECHFWVKRGEKRERRQSGLERNLCGFCDYRNPLTHYPQMEGLVAVEKWRGE